MTTEVLREFLVRIGYVQDEEKLKRFTEGLEAVTKRTFAFAAAIEATAVTVAAGVARWAANLEALYFASLRTGSSATNLKALDRAAQNFGTSAGEALASVEGLAHALRTNPGTEGLLAGLGVQVKHLKDGTVDAADAMLQLSKVFQKQPIYVAEQYAGMLGISENMLLALRNQDFAQNYAKLLKELANTNWQQAAQDAHRFMESLRDLGTLIQAFGVKVQDALQKRFGVSLESIKQWLEKNGPWLAARIVDAATKIIDAAQWIGDKVTWLIGKLKEWDAATDGLSTKLIAIGAILGVTGAGSIVGGVLSLGAAFVSLAGVLGPVVPLLAAVAASVTAIAAARNAWQGKDASNWISNLANKGFSAMTGDSIGGWLADKMNDLHQWARTPLGIRQNNPGNLRFAGQAGAINMGGFASFGTPGQGLLAMAKQLELYGSRGADTISSILSSYAPPGENDLAAYIKDVSGRMHVGAGQHLNLNDPAVLSNLMNAIINHEQGVNPYAMSAVRGAAAGAVTFNQKTDVHVNGVSDSRDVANKVLAGQDRVNRDLTRNVGAMVR